MVMWYMLAALLAAAEGLPSPGMPEVLLAAPVNATWAANHTGYWRGLGFKGFLLSGILDDLAAPLPVKKPGGEEEGALLKEIRLANERLVEAGIDRNFLFVSLGPDDTWYRDRATADRGCERFGEMGAFCRQAGLRGLALDTRPGGFMNDYRWDGYDLQSVPPERLRAGARDFGRRALRAFIRECPEAEILLVASGIEEAGPLWASLLDGLMESPGAADSLRIHLLVMADAGDGRPGPIQAGAERVRKRVRQCLSKEGAEIWERFGGLALGLEPLGVREGTPGTLVSPEDFRVQLAAAKTLSDGYVWIAAPQGGWWYTGPDEVSGYGTLQQAKAAAVRETPLLLAGIEEYAVKTPLDAMRRVGEQDGHFVLRRDEAAAVVFWNGLPQPLTLEDRSTPVTMTLLRRAQSSELFPTEKRLTVDRQQEPVMLAPLPFHDWGLPAELWMSPKTEITPKARRPLMRLGVANRSTLSLEGALEASPPHDYSLGAAVFPVRVPAGGQADFERTVQGIFVLGRALDFHMGLAIPGAGSVQRQFSFEVLPDLKWRAVLDGLPLGPPACADLDHNRMQELVCASAGGDITCYDALGTMRWERRFRTRLDVPPVVGRGRNGTFLVAAANQKGLLYLLDGQGNMISAPDLGAPCAPDALRFANLLDKDFDVLVAGLTGRRIAAFLPGVEAPLWDLAVNAPVIALRAMEPSGDTWAGAVSGRVYATIGRPKNALLCIDVSGRQLWQQDLEGIPTCAPLLSRAPDEKGFRVLTGTKRGIIEVWDAQSGRPLRHMETEAKEAVTDLLREDVHPEEGMELIAVDPGGVYCFSQGGKRLWHTPLAGAHRLAVCTLEGAPCIVAACEDGVVEGLSGTGERRWRDTRAAGSIAGAPLLMDIDSDHKVECLYVSEDRFLNVLGLGTVKAPLLPRDARPKSVNVIPEAAPKPPDESAK